MPDVAAQLMGNGNYANTINYEAMYYATQLLNRRLREIERIRFEKGLQDPVPILVDRDLRENK